jgi:predicted PurR-regulated permease PerM
MGAEIAGFLGAIVAVPIAGTIKSTIDALRHLKQPTMVSNVTTGQKPPPRDEG